MTEHQKLTLFWFRRDLRTFDNTGLAEALASPYPVICLFIFDTTILNKLEDRKDARVTFIHERIAGLRKKIQGKGGALLVEYGKPEDVFRKLLKQYQIDRVIVNADYEPYARERDAAIAELLQSQNVGFQSFKDQVIFDSNDVLKDDGKPYTVFSPYMRKWKGTLKSAQLNEKPSALLKNLWQTTKQFPFPTLKEMNFEKSAIQLPSSEIDESIIENYHQTRDIPALKGTSRISVHLRFGTVSIRSLVQLAKQKNETWLNELIWREFYMMILWHFPQVVKQSFKPQYDRIPWINKESDFEAWQEGRTGYPIVDAGMRELNQTGFMHNRVRMITASFLTKHLLIDWRWGEAYFASKLLDFELASNNGGWQWAASSGCDAVPYFRIFNPYLQQDKFDPNYEYLNKWVPEHRDKSYPAPIVEHKFARQRAINTFKDALQN